MKIIALLLAALLLQSSSCNDAVLVPAERHIINSSGMDVTLDVNQGGNTYMIAAGDTLQLIGECQYDEVRYCDLGWSNDAYTLAITFDTLRVLTFTDEDYDDRQLRRIGADPLAELYGYTAETVDGVIIYTNFITEEDFEMADPL